MAVHMKGFLNFFRGGAAASCKVITLVERSPQNKQAAAMALQWTERHLQVLPFFCRSDKAVRGVRVVCGLRGRRLRGVRGHSQIRESNRKKIRRTPYVVMRCR